MNFGILPLVNSDEMLHIYLNVLMQCFDNLENCMMTMEDMEVLGISYSYESRV